MISDCSTALFANSRRGILTVTKHQFNQRNGPPVTMTPINRKRAIQGAKEYDGIYTDGISSGVDPQNHKDGDSSPKISSATQVKTKRVL